MRFFKSFLLRSARMELYTVLGIPAGISTYIYNEHLRRQQFIKQEASRSLREIIKNFEKSSALRFGMEMKLNRADHFDSTTFSESISTQFSQLVESQYLVVSCSNPDLLTDKLKDSLLKAAHSFIRKSHSPQVGSEHDKNAVIEYCYFHMLMEIYRISLTEFMHHLSYKILQQEQDRCLEKVNTIKNAMYETKAEIIFKNLHLYFRQPESISLEDHFERFLSDIHNFEQKSETFLKK